VGTNLLKLHSFDSWGLPIGKAWLCSSTSQTIMRMSNKPVATAVVAGSSKIVCLKGITEIIQFLYILSCYTCASMICQHLCSTL